MKMWLKKNTAAEFRDLSSLRIGPMGLPWQNGYRPFHICWKYLQLDQGGRLDKRYYLPDLDALRKQPHVYKSALNSPIFEEEPPPAEKLICESRCEAPDNPTREVPNPACGAMDPQLCQARGQMDRVQAEYGLEAFITVQRPRRTIARVQNRARRAGPENPECLAARAATGEPSCRQAAPRSGLRLHQKPMVKLASKRKHLTNLIKPKNGS